MSTTNTIIDKKNNISPGIEKSLELIQTYKENETYTGWKIRGLVLQQVLLNYAEVNALRLSKLSSLIYKIEEKLLQDDVLDNIDTKSLASLYRLVLESVTDASEYIKSIVQGTKWEQFESDMLLLLTTQHNSSAESSKDIEQISREVLQNIARLAAQEQLTEHEGKV